ncbi:MAG: hypothetical protein IJ306_08465, partial [Oscillospiraceae bacterium]|nr:hypothetical protein [Oscillospiraceae bacterium]
AAAENFDANPDYSAKNIKFYYKEKPASSADDLGETAMEGIESIVNSGSDKCPLVAEIWKEVKENG